MVNKAVQREFSWAGISFTVFGLVANGVQFLAGVVFGVMRVFHLGDGSLNNLLGDMNFNIIFSMVSMYMIALPVLALMLRKQKKNPPEQHKLGAGRGFRLFLIGIAIMLIGSLIGNGLSALISGTTGAELDNTTIDAVGGMNPFLAALSVVLIGPLVEELMFRKFLIDRLRIFGEKQVLFLSALMFGLFHVNLYQLFYAFGLGLLFGYIYLRTGRLRYSYVFHMLINFFFGIVPLFFLKDYTNMAQDFMESMDLSLLTPAFFLAALYSWAEILFAIAGFVLFFVYLRKMVFVPQPYEIPKGLTRKTVYCAAGIVLFLICYGILNVGGVVAQILPQILYH